MIDKKSAEHYFWGGDCDGWHLVKRKDLSVIHERMPPDRAEVRHYHTKSRQFFFVLSGALTMEIDGAIATLQPHQGVEVPPSVPHQTINSSTEPVEVLVISHPTSRGDRILA